MTNVDWSEINKFSNMASDWWDIHGPMKPLHQLNPVRLSFVNSTVPIADKRLLDLGCGGGIFSEALAKAGANVTGLDLSSEAIEIAKLHALENGLNIDYRAQSIEDYLAYQSESGQDDKASLMDVITCMEMIEHVPSPQGIMDSIAKALSPTGIAFVSTLNRHPRAFIEAIVGAEYVLNMIPKGTHEYAKFIKPSELEAYASRSGLSMIGIKGIQYKLLDKQFYLSDNVQVNYVAVFKHAD